MDKLEKIYQILQEYNQNDEVLGAIVIGSLGKGYQTEKSDIDLELIVTDQKFFALKGKGEHYIHTKEYDIIYKSYKELERCKKSENDKDHWKYKDCPVISDKTGGLDKIVKEIGVYDHSTRINRLKKYYCEFWTEMTAAISCLRSSNMFCGRIHTTQAITAFLSLLYNINSQWAPRLKWTIRELEILEKKPSGLIKKLNSVIEQPTEDKIIELWNNITSYLREEKYQWIDRPETLLD